MIKTDGLTLKSRGLIALIVVMIAAAVLVLPQTLVRAATHAVTPGPNAIQTAINAANSGDTIEIAAGVYNESLVITKSLTLVGQGSVTIQSIDGNNKGADIQNTSNVTLTNLTFDGTNATTPPVTGIDINSVDGITLNNIVVRNYSKNGISVVTQQDPSYVVGKNPVLNNVTVENTGWAGIAFYPRSTSGNDVPLTGVQFSGTTTVSGTQYGIQFGDSATTSTVTGSSNQPVDLGVVRFVNNQANISNDNKQVAVVLSASSTINGRAIAASDFAGLNITIEGAVATPATPVVPGVPNTGRL